MSGTSVKPGRREVLKGMALGGFAAAALPGAAHGAQGLAKVRAKGASIPLIPHAEFEIADLTRAAVTRPAQTVSAAPTVSSHPLYGSDYMVDALRALDIDVIAEIPGNSFSGLHESIVNRGMLLDQPLQMFTATHEEISVAFAHGYGKASGRLAAAMVHSTVGLQHASMAIYNAWCDRAPVLTITGGLTNPDARGSYVDWLHGVSDGPALTRDFTKFDETPRTLAHFADSLARCYKMALTPPHGPVVLAVDVDLQEAEIAEGAAPKPIIKPQITAPQAELGAVREIAKLLVDAQAPVIIADRAIHSAKGLTDMIMLAELLGAPVIDIGGRMNFPWRHPLNQSSNRGAATRGADVALALEVQDIAGAMRGLTAARTISISTYDFYLKSNYQAFMAFPQLDMSIAGDAEATLPSLIEEVGKALSVDRRNAIQTRREKWAGEHAKQLQRSREAATLGWDIQPITTARVFAEVYAQVREKPWAIVGGCHFEGGWPKQLWDAKHHWQFIGDSGGMGLGYLPGAAVGAAYAHKQEGRLPIVFGGDGDLMMAPGALFTAAYHSIPLLYLVHNNGGYHQEVMKIQEQAGQRNRGIRRAHIGNELPSVDYSQIARGMGMSAQRVTEPGDLRAAIKRALDVIANGEPALIDIVSQGR